MVVPVHSELPPPVKESRGSGTVANNNLAAMTSLRHRLADEIANLRAHVVEWRGRGRKVRFWTKVIVRIIKGML